MPKYAKIDKKKSVNNVSTLIKQVECDKTWDEKDDFYQDFDFVREINEDGTYSVVLRKQTCANKKIRTEYEVRTM